MSCLIQLKFPLLAILLEIDGRPLCSFNWFRISNIYDDWYQIKSTNVYDCVTFTSIIRLHLSYIGYLFLLFFIYFYQPIQFVGAAGELIRLLVRLSLSVYLICVIFLLLLCFSLSEICDSFISFLLAVWYRNDLIELSVTVFDDVAQRNRCLVQWSIIPKILLERIAFSMRWWHYREMSHHIKAAQQIDDINEKKEPRVSEYLIYSRNQFSYLNEPPWMRHYHVLLLDSVTFFFRIRLPAWIRLHQP